MCTRNQAIDILGEVFRTCGSIFSNNLTDAILYGSYARGDYHSESDVDIMLTVDSNAENISSHRREIASIASELSLKYDVTVSITVKPLEQFQRFASVLPYYKNVIKEGIRYAI